MSEFKKVHDIPTELKQALVTLTRELRSDPNYRRGWSANIAMAFYDAFRHSQYATDVPHEDIHDIANRAAENFLQILCRDRVAG